MRTFAAPVPEHGEAALIRALQKNPADGVPCQYPGQPAGAAIRPKAKTPPAPCCGEGWESCVLRAGTK